jgi:hypothetical protein
VPWRPGAFPNRHGLGNGAPRAEASGNRERPPPPARLRRTVCGLVAAPYKTLVNMAESGAALLANLFGTQSDMPRRAGRATSPAKAGTARANGAKGGNHLARIMREG